MNKFKPSLLTLSLYAAGLSISSAPFIAHAEETSQQATQTEDSKLSKKERDDKLQKEKEIESISVKGFRGSVVKSLNTKRFSDTVVDAISADDIGGLPDVSIADALIRLPGVTAIRIDGQSSELSIRGLGSNFVLSTLNGREQVSASGGRSVQFDQYPAELIKQAQVYKSSKASLISGGIAGTVELETINALDLETDSEFRFSAHGNWNEAAADNEDSGSFGHRLTASYQTKFLDDTLGMALGYARMFQPTISSRFVNYAFKQEDLAAVYDGAPEEPVWVSSGFEINERGGEDTRNAYVAAFNFDPRDDLRFVMDVFYSDYEAGKWDRGLRVSGLDNIADGDTGLTLTNPIISNGVLIGGTFARDPNGQDFAPPHPFSQRTMNVQTQADDNSTDTSVFSIGLKGQWDISDNATITIDYGHSRAEETYKDQVMRLAMFQDASAQTPIIEDNIIMNYRLDGLGMADVTFNQDFTDISKMMVTSAESYPHIEENSIDALRIDFTYLLDSDHFTSFETGVRASKRDFELDRGRFLYGTTDFNMRNGQYITYGFEADEDGNLIPYEVERFAPYQLTADQATVTSISGDLSHMPAFLAVNNGQILNAWIPNVDRTPLRTWDHSWTMTQNNVIEEEVTSFYFLVNIDSELFGLPVTGNVGMRVVHTDQEATGLISVDNVETATSIGEPAVDDLGVVSDEWVRGSDGDSYTDYLPSFNLNFSLSDDQQLRFAYAKTLTRPDMDKLANAGGFNVFEGFINFGSNSNPKLRPYYAEQVDVVYEHYLPDSDGAFIFGIWHKDLNNIPTDISVDNFDFAAAGIEIPEPPEGEPAYKNGTYSAAVNQDDAGWVRGIEIGYTQSFKSLPEPFNGLGVNVSYSHSDSEIEAATGVPGDIDENGENRTGPLQGLSRNVYSATLFYNWEDNLEARINARYRSAYSDEQIAIGQAERAYFNDELIWSAQASYYFTDQLQAVISMDNITDEENVSYFGNQTQTGTLQFFGRTLYFGINYKM